MTQYFVVDMEAFPPGWTNSQRHNGYHAVKNGIGKQSANQPWQKTEARPNSPTVYETNEEGESVIVDTGSTASKILYSGDFTDGVIEKADICEIISEAIQVGIAAVSNKIEYEILTHEQVLTMLHDNAAEWGEVVA